MKKFWQIQGEKNKLIVNRISSSLHTGFALWLLLFSIYYLFNPYLFTYEVLHPQQVAEQETVDGLFDLVGVEQIALVESKTRLVTPEEFEEIRNFWIWRFFWLGFCVVGVIIENKPLWAKVKKFLAESKT